MNKIGIVGHFGEGENLVNGQTIKTKMLTKELQKEFGQNEIRIVDTHNWRKKPINLLINCIYSIIKCENIIILPAHNGVKIFIPLFVILNNIFKKRIYYCVIGGWLCSYLECNKWLVKYIKKIEVLFVETDYMRQELETIGINNSIKVANFKDLNIIETKDLKKNIGKPFKICTLSRVNYEKGIEDLCEAISIINEKHKETVFQLDVFGPVENDYKNKFYEINNKYSEFMKYKGVVNAEDTTNIIKEYFLLVFPTKYKTEGIPGTIIDSYASGTPVLAANWNSCYEIVEDNKTGKIYEFNDKTDLVRKMELVIQDEFLNNYQEFQVNCINEAKKYLPSISMQVYFSYFNKKEK